MAYVLGVIYTDGNLIPGSRRDSKYKNRSSRFSVSQKEPELLEKVLALMDCNATLYRTKQRLTGNPLYSFHVNEEEMYNDLLKLGLTPKKSLTMQFPCVPDQYLRDFIRGCWDGDGSVYFESEVKPRASYITGSKGFLAELVKHLVKLGLPQTNIYTTRVGRSFYIRFSGEADCSNLFHLFYKGVPASMYLRRKFELFYRIALNWEGSRVLQGKPHLAFPKPFTRSTLADLLKISPRQVERIMESGPIVAAIQELSHNSGSTSKEFKAGLRQLKNQVNRFLYGWDD